MDIEMEKTINGRRYSTFSATMIHRFQTPHLAFYRDFQSVRETLYRKRTGEYFLCGAGWTPEWCTFVECGRDFGVKIKPLSRRGAYLWLKNHCARSFVEAEFPDHASMFDPNSDRIPAAPGINIDTL